jgi:hypothetical protein
LRPPLLIVIGITIVIPLYEANVVAMLIVTPELRLYPTLHELVGCTTNGEVKVNSHNPQSYLLSKMVVDYASSK